MNAKSKIKEYITNNKFTIIIVILALIALTVIYLESKGYLTILWRQAIESFFNDSFLEVPLS